MDRWLIFIAVCLVQLSSHSSLAFAPSLGPSRQVSVGVFPSSRIGNVGDSSITVLFAKKKRRRKQKPGEPAPEPAQSAGVVADDPAPVAPVAPVEQEAKSLVEPIEPIESSEPPKAAASAEKKSNADADMIAGIRELTGVNVRERFDILDVEDVTPMDSSKKTTEDGILLPDFSRDSRSKREKELMEEAEDKKIKIQRGDAEALRKLIEMEPFADADDSFFIEEEYSTINALLGERAKSFVGIPSGPLQVGHFVGALVIVLMAFVEYPGFPLTNLPTPIRGALQGGLGTIYAINFVLAVLSVFKAGERGQPALLWVAKTFTVGGLAYDQLTQIPTLDQIKKERAKRNRRQDNNKRK